MAELINDKFLNLAPLLNSDDLVAMSVTPAEPVERLQQGMVGGDSMGRCTTLRSQ